MNGAGPPCSWSGGGVDGRQRGGAGHTGATRALRLLLRGVSAACSLDQVGQENNESVMQQWRCSESKARDPHSRSSRND